MEIHHSLPDLSPGMAGAVGPRGGSLGPGLANAMVAHPGTTHWKMAGSEAQVRFLSARVLLWHLISLPPMTSPYTLDCGSGCACSPATFIPLHSITRPLTSLHYPRHLFLQNLPCHPGQASGPRRGMPGNKPCLLSKWRTGRTATAKPERQWMKPTSRL